MFCFKHLKSFRDFHICMSLSKDPCIYAITTSMKRKSSPFKIVKKIRYLNMVVFIIGKYVIPQDPLQGRDGQFTL